MKDKMAKVVWNALFFLLCILVVVLLIQHAAFFYTWPPDIGKLVGVPWYLYIILGLPVYILFKTAHYVEEMSEVDDQL
jgi:hypothetical protein